MATRTIQGYRGVIHRAPPEEEDGDVGEPEHWRHNQPR